MYLEASPSLLNFMEGTVSSSSSDGRERVKPEIRVGIFGLGDLGDPESGEFEASFEELAERNEPLLGSEDDGEQGFGELEC